MLAKRTEVSTPDDELYIAITEGYFLLVQVLIGGHMNVNCQNNSGATALIAVCRSFCNRSKEAKLEFVRFLLKERARVDIIDSFGKTAINYAEENDLKTIMKELLLTGLK
jgi:ankyrin repeat protein